MPPIAPNLQRAHRPGPAPTSQVPVDFRADGDTYDPAEDQARLGSQQVRVQALMADGQWRTLAEIAQAAGGSEASVSARLRDLRKKRFGGFVVDRERQAGGLFRYRLSGGGV